MKHDGLKWLAVAFAISVGLWVTHNPNCLWAFIFLLFL